jgi:polyisoprenoid-binding protein YceI
MLHLIRTVVVLGSLLAALAACGSTASQTTTASPAASAATAGMRPASQPTLAGNVRTFQIVPEQTEASYEVQEQLLRNPLPNKAVGKTNAVAGAFQFTNDGKPAGNVTKITVDLRTLTSDKSMRDRRIRRQWLESDTYPFAEFVSTAAQQLPDSYREGQEVSFKLAGDMTIREITRPVTFEVRGKLQGDTVTGTATTVIMMKDFGFDPPNVAGLLTVEDGVTITVNFTAKEAAGS